MTTPQVQKAWNICLKWNRGHVVPGLIEDIEKALMEERSAALVEALEKYERWLCPHGEPIGKLAREALAAYRKAIGEKK